MRQIQRLTVLAVLLLAAIGTLADTTVFETNSGAIRGYDPVAYFRESRAVEGSEQFVDTWNNTTWYFASAENRDAFREDPERYAPQYGGHCAYAMRSGKLVSVDPEAWHIIDGKLYLNYSKRIQKRWLKDPAGFIAEADAQWADKHAMPM